MDADAGITLPMAASTAICRYGSVPCDTCECDSLKYKWASYRVVRGDDGEVREQIPTGPDCFDCVATGIERFPGEEWPVIKKRINATAASKEEHLTRVKIRRGLQKPNFLPESVWQTRKVTGKWITTLVPKCKSEMSEALWRKIQQTSKVPVEHYEDGLGNSHQCVMLKDDRFPDRMELTVEKSTEIGEFCFDGTRQLDATQASEIYDKFRAQMMEERPERHFGSAMTWEQLQASLRKPATAGDTPATGGNNAGPAEASVPSAENPEVVSMVGLSALGQRLTAPMETESQDARGTAAATKKRPKEQPKEPKQASRGSKKHRKAAGVAAVDGGEIEKDDPNYLKLPSMNNILAGTATRDKKTIKQLLYHFSLQLDNATTLETSERNRLGKELLRKTAAATLDPTSIRKLPEEEYKHSYALVLQSSEELPPCFWVNVLHREFERMKGESSKNSVSDFLSLEGPPRTLDEARAKGPAQRLAEVPMYWLRPPQRVQVCAQLLLKTVVPVLAAQKQGSSKDILQMRSSLLPALDSMMKGDGDAIPMAPMAEMSSIRQCVLAMSAPFQKELMSGEQLQVLTAVKNPKEEHEKVLHESFDDTWWRLELRSTIEKGIYEVQEGPGVQDLHAKLGGPRLEDSEFMSALKQIMSESGFALWRLKMRKIVTDSVLEDLAKQCDEKLTEWEARAGNPEPSTVSQLQEVCACVAWLEDILDREEKKSEVFSRFGALLQRTRQLEVKADAKLRLSSGLVRMEECLKAPALTSAALAAVSADFAQCRGLRFEQSEDADTAWNFAQTCLSQAPDWKQGARVASSVLASAPDPSMSPKRSVLGLTVDYVTQVAALEVSDGVSEPVAQGQESNASPNVEELEKTKQNVEAAYVSNDLGVPADYVKDWDDICKFLEQAQAKASREKADYIEQQQKPIVARIEEIWQLILRQEKSWKDHLPENPEWSDVVREIEYSFWRRRSGTNTQQTTKTIMDEVNDKYTKLTSQFSKFQKMCEKNGIQMPDGLSERVTAVKTATETADCEEYFVRKLEMADNKTADKLTKRKVRIATMNSFKYDQDIHPLIRARVDKFIADES